MSRNFVAASSQYLDVGSTPVTAAPLTLAAWFRTGLSTSVDRVLVGLFDGASNNWFFIEDYASDVDASIHDPPGQSDALAGTVTTNAWQHAAGVYASTTSHTAYLNGVAGTTNTTSRTPLTTTRIVVGRGQPAAPFGYMNGDIADVAIWNVALSGAEVASLAAGASPASIQAGALVFYAPLMGEASPEPDSTSGARNLTITGATPSPHPDLLTFRRFTNPAFPRARAA